MVGNLNPLLLQALAASRSGESSPQASLLSQFEGQDPAIALLTQYLTQQSHSDAEDDASDHTSEAESNAYLEELKLAHQRNKELVRVVRFLRQQLDVMTTELDEMRDRTDVLAQALGACYLCWGEDRDCDVCRGQGYPGAFAPDPDMYRQYVVPVMRHLKQGADSGSHHHHHQGDHHVYQ